MPEYNLNNPSVTEEERMIQDRIDEKYAMREAETEAYYKMMEEKYHKEIEKEYYKSLRE